MLGFCECHLVDQDVGKVRRPEGGGLGFENSGKSGSCLQARFRDSGVVSELPLMEFAVEPPPLMYPSVRVAIEPILECGLCSEGDFAAEGRLRRHGRENGCQENGFSGEADVPGR